MFHVYVDHTDLDVPFYVGKGKSVRVSDVCRNSKHKHVSLRHGFNRTIMRSFTDESAALDYEKHLISMLHTFYRDPEADDLACNFTLGGDGISGWKHSDESRRLMSDRNHTQSAIKNRENARKKQVGDRAPFFGCCHAQEYIKQIRESKWINNKIQTKRVKPHELQDYLDSGWQLGRKM